MAAHHSVARLNFFFLVLAGRTLGASDSAAGQWSDFTDKFATDIAPLITLFGEQVTKQFLSESTGLLDNIIFGMAPLGIITAVVSAIRVYGSPSLKSFIGRAQEPHGVAEAELCSSTSRDVCELWSEGGICRVFGRPKVLEFFYRPGKNDFYRKFTPEMTEKEVGRPAACNIYRPICFLDGKRCCNEKQKLSDNGSSHEDYRTGTCEENDNPWHETSGDSVHNRATDAEGRDKDVPFAPYPNLALNIGIRQTPPPVLVFIAIFGVSVQLSFFVFATRVTFYWPSLYTDEKQPSNWGFVLAILGTLLVVLGMTLCAFLIERKSHERWFDAHQRLHTQRKGITRLFKWVKDLVWGMKNVGPAGDTTIYWLQPGDQRVGDQQFNAFAHSKQRDTYITSWKMVHGKADHGKLHYLDILLWVALFSSLVGFVLQFVGFRGLHGAIALYQIGATLLMTLVRAFLRYRRLRPGDNDLQNLGTTVEKHELDWQATVLFRNSCGQKASWHLADDRLRRVTHSSGAGSAEFPVCVTGPGVVGYHPTTQVSGEQDRWESEHHCANAIMKQVEKLERGEGILSSTPNPGALIALYRTRLAYITGDGIVRDQPTWDSEVRTVASSLQQAIEALANYVFSGDMSLQDGWQGVKALSWYTACQVRIKPSEVLASNGEPEYPGDPYSDTHNILALAIFCYGREWKISKYHLEAIISLWSWSTLEGHSADQDFYDKTLLAREDSTGSMFSTLKLWIPAANLKIHEEALVRSPRQTAWSVHGKCLVSGGRQLPLDQRTITMRATSSKTKLMAQDLFTIFFSRIAGIMVPLDIVDEDLFSMRGGAPGLEERWARSSERFLGLSNTHVKTMTTFFVNSGLGSEAEALMCMIPVLVQSSILPHRDQVMTKLLHSARDLRRRKQFPKAEAILKVILGHVNPLPMRQSILCELGEVYRKAFMLEHKGYGLEGLEIMSRFLEACLDLEACLGNGSDNRDFTDFQLKGWPDPYRLKDPEVLVIKQYKAVYKCFRDSPVQKRGQGQDLDHLKQALDSLREVGNCDHSHDPLTISWQFDLPNLMSQSQDLDLAVNLVATAIRESCPQLMEDLFEIDKKLATIPIHTSSASMTALEMALRENVGTEVIDIIFECGAVDPNHVLPGHHHTPLSLATSLKRVDAMRLLLDRGANVNLQAVRNGWPPLFFGIVDEENGGSSCDPEFTKTALALFFQRGAERDNTDDQRMTPIEKAVEVRNETALKILGPMYHNTTLPKFLLHRAAQVGGADSIIRTIARRSDVDIDAIDTSRYKFKLFRPAQVLESVRGAPIHVAIDAGNADVVQLLLTMGADTPERRCNVNLEIPGDFGFAIILACSKRDPDIVQLLLDHAADPKAVAPIGCALSVACANEAVELVKILLQHNPDVNEKGGKLGTPLLAAINAGNLEIVHILIKNGAGIDLRGGNPPQSPLLTALSVGNVEITKTLINSGVDISRISKDEKPELERIIARSPREPCTGSTLSPLLVAINAGSPKLVEILTRSGANPNKDGGNPPLSPLIVAIKAGSLQIVEILLKCGANPNEDGGNPPLSPLAYAIEVGSLQIVEILLGCGANVNILSGHPRLSPLGVAIRVGSLEIFERLVTQCEDANIVSGLLPLLLTSDFDTYNIFLLLSKNGADLEFRDALGRTPLLLATQYRRSGLVRAFLQQGVNPDPHDYYGSSPLSIAARHCDARAVDLLLTLSRGCVDVNSRDHLGRTPLWWARRGGSDDVMELLLKGGADESSISARDNDVPVPIKAGPASNGSRFIRCDICTMCILDGDIYYHCGDCNFGDFDICQDCYQNGERCLETGHDLVQCPAVI